MIGAGYVGLVTAVGLAELGHTVELTERRPDRLAALRSGRVPIHEPGLQTAFEQALTAGRLSVSERPTIGAEVAMVCVGTPIGPDGQSDLGQLRTALADLAPVLGPQVPLVIRSTLPPGGTQLVIAWAGVPAAQVVTNPEFLRQGSALADFRQPSRIVVGRSPSAAPETFALVIDLYDRIETPRLVVDVASAELIKNGANAFLALKLSFANELAGMAETYGADIDDVLGGIAIDPRIGSQYLRPSFGFGGSCLPKELLVLAASGAARGLPMQVATAASAANATSQARFAARIAEALGGLERRRVAMLGLAFKAGTDDVRNSPAIAVSAALLDGGAEVVGYDPQANGNAAAELPGLRVADGAAAALAGADAAVIATEWPEFAVLDWASLRPTMRQSLVLDGRRLLDGQRLRALGYRYLAVGSPETAP